MPFYSLAEEGYLHEHPEILGKAKLAEFDAATKGKHLPERSHVSTHSSYDHAGAQGSHAAIDGIVSDHGLAKGHSHHSPDGQTHTVITHHEDGHTHESNGHPHMEHVMEHIRHAHGG